MTPEEIDIMDELVPVQMSRKLALLLLEKGILELGRQLEVKFHKDAEVDLRVLAKEWL